VLEVRLTHTVVEVFHKGQRVAAHPRHAPGRFSTLAEHIPKRHQAHRDWSPSRFLEWATGIGVATREMTQRQLQDRPHPEHGYRACLGLLQLSRRYGKDRLEQACAHALAIPTTRYASIASILKQGLDQQPMLTLPEALDELPPHTNVRGREYYH
jgi:transposase